jgi:heme-degrading monooxygenase HmoA
MMDRRNAVHARVSFYNLGNASRDDAARAFDDARGPVEQMQGNQGGMLLVSPDTGRAITITFWESEEALRASGQQASQARQQAAGSAGMEIANVEAYEVALEFGR